MAVIVVTDRKACRGDFFERLQRIAAAKPAAILLRETDVSAETYTALAARTQAICAPFGVEPIVHSHVALARDLDAGVHLRLADLKAMGCAPAGLGISCAVHSEAEARLAEKLGATRLIAGHIFETACKAGTPGRGVEFLQAVCAAVSIPVYAIGGIAPERMTAIRTTNAAGVCIMSSAMTCPDPAHLLAALSQETDG